MITILIIVVLLFLSAFFSGSETAFTSLSAYQVESLAESKGKRGRILKQLYEKSNIFIATIRFESFFASPERPAKKFFVPDFAMVPRF